MSRLWLNARYLSRHRPALREQVLKQEELWRGRLVEVIGAGVEEGVFTTADPLITAIQILVVMDGLAAHANTDRGERPAAVNDLAATTAERELGLPRGTLAERARAMTLDAMAPDAMAPYTATA
ncbi:TetR family transcriptional regulator C-terminal domain-containing protein [Streptomyces sp. PTM05]|uniref:TetR family transcriptional regulator C-terminal domain-containing protein n=2 Tax=Streptantibioticus parmotrematis TaxID=2873249 RepID=A0ABS7QUD8_9ACTN|nr:TetR family transcriptional regulator C-terminal domain-containing protein [Streptantibioticus parmotrematis]